MRFKRWFGVLAVLFGMATFAARAEEAKIEIKKAEAKDQYDVTYNGKLFTSYCYDEKEFFDKPVFFPVLSAGGVPVNRGWPMIKDVEGEAKDHPHHQSLFFTYDEVNGVHFWNAATSGRRIKQREASVDGNTLNIVLEWNDNEGKTLLVEHRKVRFGAGEGVRWMDHDILLAAQNGDVEFGDTKEGAFGIRVAKSLEETGGTGSYINAEGLEKSSKVWGKTSPWVALRGDLKTGGADEPVTIAIYSHPTSLNQPPYWHARNYGLFAVNPFGRKSYDKSAEERKMTLKAGDNLHLRYRVAVYEGKTDKARLDKDFAEFSK